MKYNNAIQLRLSVILTLIFFLPFNLAALDAYVYDSKTKLPIENALITIGNELHYTDSNGLFQIEGEAGNIRLRAPGYRRGFIDTTLQNSPKTLIYLDPLTVKGLYLSVYGIGHKGLREAARNVMKENDMNALVIDVKGDRGFIPFKTDFATAADIGAQKIITVRDIQGLLDELRNDDIYLIARIVVFKDDLLATAKPEWAVKTSSGTDYIDYESLKWVDPFIPEVWDYNIEIAKFAAELGFDEIQFDYVRFPDKRGLVFSSPANEESRTDAITGFLQTARESLIPYNVHIAADIFGYVLWNANDTDIGQKLHSMLDSVDIISPMLYPSGFQHGIPKYKNPMTHPFEIVYHSLKKAQERSDASPLRFRPWLQAFRDYAFNRATFGDEKIRAQIKAAEDFGSSGWMLWNPRNVYPELILID